MWAHPKDVPKSLPIEADKTELGACHYKISVKVPAERVTEEFDHAYKSASRGMKIPGFRPGKAPATVLRQLLGDGIQEHAAEHLFEHTSGDALGVVGLRNEVLRMLDFDSSQYTVEDGVALEFEFEVETMPQIDLPEWSDIDVEPAETEASDEQIQEALDGLGHNHAKFDEVEDGSVDEELLAEIDLLYELDGEAGPEAKELKFGLGSPLYGADPDKYDEALRGTQAGSEFELDVEFNEGFSKEEWVGKSGVAKIKVLKVLKQRPATKDELCESLGLESPEILDERLVARIAADNSQRERERQAHEILATIVNLHPFELPARMIEEEAAATTKSNKERMIQQGATEEQAEEEAAKHEEQMVEDAEKRLKHWFILRKVGAEMKVRVTSKDLDMAYRSISMQQQVDVKMVKSYYKEQNMVDNLRGEILESKVRSTIVDVVAKHREEKAVAPLES
ncbi:MAG: trigger factor [Planctomycetota bacterium]|nr:MAG: trigger factor [Planctomycetota bacterium]